ncbi:ATP-binding cassette domain-containing protein [Fluviibacterium sp. DFM31]|uniref:ATP-binding cassette domain-containing protein n=1 Tax=Meridianimarinicoccus marinus TaxID=3231483 RepID=A0ABV3L959_9RHOB
MGQTPAMTALQIDNLEYRWPGAPSNTLAIGSLHLKAGETLFLHGPSGCGKSTLISAIAGVVDLPEDAVRVGSQDMGRLRGGARDRFRVDHLGMIFQVFNLVPWLSALENVLLPCTFSQRRHDRAGGAPATAAQTLLDELGLDGPVVASKPASSLSVGQQQRVAAARALIGAPDLILADEPTSSLDEAAKVIFVDLLVRECARSGTALVFVSHDRGLEQHFDRSVDFRDLNRLGV